MPLPPRRTVAPPFVDSRPDRKARLWTARGNEKARLAWHRRDRAALCGCERCRDGDRAARLDELIAVCQARIAQLEDMLCEH